jgi:hypothetical protein
MRRLLGTELNRIAKTLTQEDTYEPAIAASFCDAAILEHSRYGDYVRDIGNRFHELASVISNLNTRTSAVELCAPSTVGATR